MSKHNLEADLRELADNIDDCAVGTWWSVDKGCGCPMAQLAIRQGLATDMEIEESVVENGDTYFLEPRFLNYYVGQGHLVRLFPMKFDVEFDIITDFYGKQISSEATSYCDDPKIIKETILATLDRIKAGF